MIKFLRARSLRKLAVGVVLVAAGCAAGSTKGSADGELLEGEAQGQSAIGQELPLQKRTAAPLTSQERVGEPVPPRPQSSAPISISWRIPAQPVDGFILYYGPSPEKLDSQVRLSIEQLGPAKEDEGQQAYRYILRGVALGQRTLVSIASFRGNQISPPSAPMEVSGEPPMRRDQADIPSVSEKTDLADDTSDYSKDSAPINESAVTTPAPTPSPAFIPESSPTANTTPLPQEEVLGS